jgi:hypothetical protein
MRKILNARRNLLLKVNQYKKMGIKSFLMKKMLASQLKGVPEAQVDMILNAVEKNPKLFEDIAKEVQEKIKGGMDQQAATMQVMMAHQKELQEVMK